ncbi:hypothetical protein LPAF129_21350 [Ligilactobacillus pabuli]|uniref:Uncharacterized protein n=1 Tax=Ligilactobacillus pabuli TaxID=2886039 RepID=A0ABQ5JK22_9LACO|nr:hypothetical protein [Ligilactobacillus pabuli]GKS82449.1 hypothetical protein LPAF129_21350 [Ligilactobacillus pabuli]
MDEIKIFESLNKTFICVPLGFADRQNEVLINGEKTALNITMNGGDEKRGLATFYVDKLLDKPIKVEKVKD